MTFVPRDGALPELCENPYVPRPTRIVSRRGESSDVFSMTLDGGPPFVPGQFNMLYAFGVGEVAISISSDPARATRPVHTIRELGAVTRALGRLRAGDVVGVRGPFGRGWPIDELDGADVLLIAGGLGLAPLRPVLYHLLARRRSYGRVALLYGARTPEDLLYRRKLEQLQSRPDVETLVTVDRADRSWAGHVGVVTSLLRLASFDPARAIALICGPEVMIRFTIRELERLGVESDRIHLSLERSMKCAIAFCGHCQFGPSFICKDGPVLRHDRVRPLLTIRGL